MMDRRTFVAALPSVFLVSHALAQEPDEKQRFDLPEKIELIPGRSNSLSGSYDLDPGAHVILFLHDRFGGGRYLQWPECSLLKGNWMHDNVRAGESNITQISAVLVDEKGFATVERWAKSNRWGKIPEAEIKKLSGFKELDRAAVQVK